MWFARYRAVEAVVFVRVVAQFQQAVYRRSFAIVKRGGQLFGGEALIVYAAAQPPGRSKVDLVLDGDLVGGIAENLVVV